MALSAGFLDVMECNRLRGLPLTTTRIQAVVELLEPGVSSRVVSLAQGALAAMLTEKMKWLALAIAAPSLVLVAAGTALLAGSRPGSPGIDPVPTVQVGSRGNQRLPAKGDSGTVKTGAERPAITSSLDSDKVNAELLEMETEALQNSLKRLLQQQMLGNRPGFGDPRGRQPLGKEQEARLEEDYARYRKELGDREDELRRTYLMKKMDLAELKRRIARQSRELGQFDTETPTMSEVAQRLRTLETKVDRILEAVSKDSR
jgi:hypothetical protein